MKNFFYLILAVVFVGATAFAAVSSFPYTTTFQTDNIGAGNWTVNNTHGEDFANVSTAGSGDGDDFSVAVTQNTNSNGTYSALRVTLNTTGLTFTGAESFDFKWKGSSTKCVLQVWENSSGSFAQVGANVTLDQTVYTLGSFALPSGMGNKSSVDLEIRILQNANGNPNATFSIDNPTLTGGALPIQLSSFTGIALENTVQLDWATESETNNYGWYIERMGEYEANYSELSFVGGAGTTLEPQVYSYSDENVASGKYYYRLRQVDLTGDVSYSQPIQVVVSGVLSVGDNVGPVVFKLNQNYPNPFNPSTEIKYSVAAAGLVTLKVYNLIGQEVATLVSQEQTAGFHTVKFDASSLSSGIYMYRLLSGVETAVKSMMLVK